LKIATTIGDITGCRVLVVEDETLIAFEIEAALEALGCEIVGPVSTLDAALRLAKEAALDAAILDVTIRGGKSYPIAEQLIARNIPFVLSSGYGEWALPHSLRDRPRLNKPFTAAELEEQVRFLCGEVGRRGRAVAPNGPSSPTTVKST
jgi:DNA-binding response OmpR family regulator